MVTPQALDARQFNAYQLRLPAFEGPLDVLLRLIEKQQLPISDISLVMITDQFLEYLETAEGISPDAIVEFAGVGARLVLLKARSLLPRPTIDDEEEPSDLVIQLLEYREVKEAAMRLAQIDRAGEMAFARGERAIGTPIKSAEVRLAQHQASALARALRRKLAVLPTPSQLTAIRPVVTLREMGTRMLARLRRSDTTFDEIAGDLRDNHEIRAAFLAMLVLVRRRVIDADQSEPFGQIDLHLRDAALAGTDILLTGEEFGE